jgi:phosphoribulokinase
MTLQESRMHHRNFKDTIAASPCIFTLGVAGDSGSGKTTFTQGVRSIFGDDLVSTITLDDYHSLDRDGRMEQGITALDPGANRIEQLELDLIRLKQGEPIEKPVYNHSTEHLIHPSSSSPGKSLSLKGCTRCSPRRCEKTLISPSLWIRHSR